MYGKGLCMINELISRYPALDSIKTEIVKAKDLIIETYKNDGKILVCGNGGSAADSEHIVGELMKGFLLKRPVTDERIPQRIREKLQGGLPAISLPSQSAVLSAFVNDVEAEMLYAQLVYGYARKNDIVIGISTSGNSKNIVNAVETANAIGVTTIALTGKNESRLSELSDVTIKAPETETYKVQELHLPIYHYLCAETEKYFFEY